MDSSVLIGLEMAGVLGLALAWGGYELWSLRKWREREKSEQEEKAPEGVRGASAASSDVDDKLGR